MDPRTRLLPALLLWALSAAACRKGVEDSTVEIGDDCRAARDAEHRGDYATARSSYASCLARTPGFVDIHAAYARILELEDGIEAARGTYAALVARNPGVSSEFAHARLLPADERTVALERLAVTHPDFAPVFYALADAHSERVLGSQSLAAKRREKLYLETFLRHASGPAFVAHFADYAFAEAWVHDARARLAKLGDISPLAVDPPLKMTATPSSAGWMIHFLAKEPTRSMQVRVADGDWREFDMYVTAPLQADAFPVQVRYTDGNGHTQGPFDFTVDPRRELVAFGKGVLSKMPTAWAAFGEDLGAPYFYITTLMAYRCSLRRVEYGLGVATPDREYRMPECDPRNPMAIPRDVLPYISVDPALPFVSLRLTYGDGDVSEIERIERK